jgi:hypothetical protein
VAVGIGLRLARPEDPRAFGVQHPLRDELVDRGPRLEVRIELQRRARPQQARIELALNVLVDPLVADRARTDSAECRKSLTESLAHCEDVHEGGAGVPGTVSPTGRLRI